MSPLLKNPVRILQINNEGSEEKFVVFVQEIQAVP